MIKKIKINNTEITYELQRKNVKNINLRIKADGKIYLSANKRVSQKMIDEFIISKADAILSALEKFRASIDNTQLPKKYIDGEIILYLGQRKTLKIVKANKNSVELTENNIILYVTDTDNKDLKKKILDRWLRDCCMIIVNSICLKIYPIFEKYGIPYPQIKFRKMVSIWGSCQPERKILTFNTALIYADILCIEYVIIHEFTHFLEPNHSKRFYDKMSNFMPSWKLCREKLSEINIRG